jgi:hypothetical protein
MLDTDIADAITDEVHRLAQSMLAAIDRISATSHDRAAVQAAKLSLGALLLSQTVTSEAGLATVNAIWDGRLRAEWAH